MRDEGYQPVKVIAINSKNEEEIITLHQNIERGVGEELEDDERDVLSMMVHACERSV